ncbi:hypothetical protein HZS_5044 [Henneguya salminicola]|nr:hypothetical protein HZS_5044 [Henneguya salminicola]
MHILQYNIIILLYCKIIRSSSGVGTNLTNSSSENMNKICSFSLIYLKPSIPAPKTIYINITLSLIALNSSNTTAGYIEYSIKIEPDPGHPILINLQNCTKEISDVVLRYDINQSEFQAIDKTPKTECLVPETNEVLSCKTINEKCQCVLQRTYVETNLEVERPPISELNSKAIIIGLSLPILLIIIITILSVFYTRRKQQGVYNPRKQELDGAMEAFGYLKPPKLEHYFVIPLFVREDVG